MLQPSKPKWRNQHKGRMRGAASRCNKLAFGDYGLRAMECGRVDTKQIEAGRIAMTRFIKRGGRVWIRIFPDKPITKKPAEVRMGKGKGALESWVAVIRPGQILYEMEGVTDEVAKEAFHLAAHKLNIQTRMIKRGEEFGEG